jgi:hypothetical protein
MVIVFKNTFILFLSHVDLISVKLSIILLRDVVPILCEGDDLRCMHYMCYAYLPLFSESFLV